MALTTVTDGATHPATPDLSCEIELEPGFYDLDPMEIVWHGNYLKYMEQARCALLARFDYGYPQMRDSGYAWPVVDLRVKYVRSVRFGQRVKVQVKIVEWESRLCMDYLITDAQTGERITKAHSTQVAVDLKTGELCFVCPSVLWERLGVSPT